MVFRDGSAEAPNGATKRDFTLVLLVFLVGQSRHTDGGLPCLPRGPGAHVGRFLGLRLRNALVKGSYFPKGHEAFWIAVGL